MRRVFDFVLLASFALVAHPGTARAQATASSVEPGSCLGFRFGPWSPPLDWHASGHAGTPAAAASPLAPGGRGWAASIHPDAEGDMLLFPTWWPVGVAVDLPQRAFALGDTAEGRATALVANGVTPSSAAVRAWRVPCGDARGDTRSVRAAGASTGAATTQALRDPNLNGTWRGTSICLTAHGQCGRDSVVYRIAADADDPDSVSLAASTVGIRGERPADELHCRYDAFSSILSCDAPNGMLRLAVRGSELGGRLTRRDGVDLRYVHVRRAGP